MSNEGLIAEALGVLRKRPGMAESVAPVILRLIDALKAAERKPVIDREKFLAWCADYFGDPDELPEDYAEQWDSLMQAGLIEDKRAVQAEALEAAAERMHTEHGRMWGVEWIVKKLTAWGAEIREGRA